MISSTICKFTPLDLSRDFTISCFVFECSEEIMKANTTLTHSRMILIEQGEGTFLFDNIPYSFSAGTLIFGFKDESFSLLKGEGVRYLYIDFHGERGNALCQRFEITPSNRTRQNFNALVPFCMDCLIRTDQENIDIASESVLLYVFSRLSAEHLPQNDTIQRVIEYTKEHFQDADLSIATIAVKIGYNPKYLSHFFKKKMNVGYSEYLRSFRLQYALSLFKLGLSSIKNVALLSGFSDPLYFSSIFKKEIGISPKEFIQAQSNHP